MKNILLWMSTIMVAGCCVHGTVQHPAPKATFVEDLENKVVALTYTDDDGLNEPFCGGVWVSPTKIMTANHCAEAAVYLAKGETPREEGVNPIGTKIDYIVRSDFDGSAPETTPKKVRKGRVIAFDRESDLALITVDAETAPKTISYADIVDDGRITDGDRVHVVGHPVGFWWTYSSGYVSNTWSDIEGPEPMRGQMLQVSAPVWNGNSGGGAFDEKGHLIGIASWISKAGPQLSFFVHRDVIIKFMKVHDR